VPSRSASAGTLASGALGRGPLAYPPEAKANPAKKRRPLKRGCSLLVAYNSHPLWSSPLHGAFANPCEGMAGEHAVGSPLRAKGFPSGTAFRARMDLLWIGLTLPHPFFYSHQASLGIGWG